MPAAKWLSFVASRDDAVFRTHGAFDDWPHAVGCLGVNPIFAAERIEADATHYRFEFPDRWYAYEDEAYREYTALSRVEAGVPGPTGGRCTPARTGRPWGRSRHRSRGATARRSRRQG